MKLGIWLAAASGILYGSIGFFGVKLMEQGFSVSNLLFWRFCASTFLLLPFLPSFLKQRHDAKVLWALFCLGGLFYGGGTAAYFESSKTIGTGLAMVIFFAYPIFVVFLSTFIRKTPLTGITLISLALIVLGCTLIAFGKGFRLEFYGIMLAILSGLGYGFYVFWSKQVGGSVPPLLATFVICLGNMVAFLAFSFLSQSEIVVPGSATTWAQIGLFGLVGTVLPVLLLLAAMKTISANKASIISVLEPVTVLAVGAIVLAEEVTSMQLVGAVAILCSAMVVQLDKAKEV